MPKSPSDEPTHSRKAGAKRPLAALLHLARLNGGKGRNSPAGGASVAGESAARRSGAAFSEPAPENFDPQQRRFMLRLARASLADAAVNPYGSGPTIQVQNLAPKLLEKHACFVTLTSEGALRGCIGNILPQKPLYQAIIDNARSAAVRDPRFPPVQTFEVDHIKIEISVLTEPQPLAFASPEELLDALQPRRDGVLLHIGGHGATFLPQVWEKVPDKIEFLNRLSEKAGCEPSAWRGEETSVSIYQVESFEEEDVPGPQASGV